MKAIRGELEVRSCGARDHFIQAFRDYMVDCNNDSRNDTRKDCSGI